MYYPQYDPKHAPKNRSAKGLMWQMHWDEHEQIADFVNIRLVPDLSAWIPTGWYESRRFQIWLTDFVPEILADIGARNVLLVVQIRLHISQL